MNPLRHIVCATDFSDDAKRALRRAAGLAARAGARLSLVHVVSESSLLALRALIGLSSVETRVRENALQRLEDEAQAVRSAHPGLRADVDLRTGQPIGEVLDASREADLLVIGAHGQNPLRDILIGTTAERLLRHAERPVLVCRAPGENDYRKVLVALDLSEQSLATLRAARVLAPDAALAPVHALELPFEGQFWLAGVPEDEIERLRTQARAHALRDVRALMAELGNSAADIEPRVEAGAAARILIDTAREIDAGLIVVARHARSAVERLFIGSVTRHVLAEAQCDVLVTQA